MAQGGSDNEAIPLTATNYLVLEVFHQESGNLDAVKLHTFKA
jgi:hypothetical protein